MKGATRTGEDLREVQIEEGEDKLECRLRGLASHLKEQTECMSAS